MLYCPLFDGKPLYVPLLKQFLKTWAGMAMTLTLDTSMLWDEYCLIEVCLAWGGRSFPSAQKVMKHGSATVAFGDYCSALDAARTVLPTNCQITLLADRGFEHGELIRCGSVLGEDSPGHLPWFHSHQWSWAIRAKSDLRITVSNAQTESVADLLPEPEQAFLFTDVTILGDIQCHLVTARLSMAQEAWAVITDTPPSVQTSPSMVNGLAALNLISRITSLRPLSCLVLESEMRML
jgi:hypothetical protein